MIFSVVTPEGNKPQVDEVFNKNISNNVYLDVLLLSEFALSQMRNLFPVFPVGAAEGYPTMLATLQGSDVAQGHFKLGCPF